MQLSDDGGTGGSGFSLLKPGVREAYVVSWISMVCTVLAVLLGFVVFAVSESSSTLGFALENAVDSFSSALVLWRFWGGGSVVPEAILELREKRASVGIAIAFVVLALVVGSVAIEHLTEESELSSIGALLALASPSVVIFFFLGVLKLHIGYATDSASMKKDAACSLCGATLSLGVCVGAGVHRNSRLWWIDATVAVVVSAGLLLYGLFTLAKNAQQGNRWWSPTFWMVAPKRGTVQTRPAAELAPPLHEFSSPIAATPPARLPPQAV